MYIKLLILSIILVIVSSFIVISFDPHAGYFSPTCPVCQAKVSLNGGRDVFTLEFHPLVTAYRAVEQLPGAIIVSTLQFDNRGSPAPSL